jgi:hypothetical protein
VLNLTLTEGAAQGLIEMLEEKIEHQRATIAWYEHELYKSRAQAISAMAALRANVVRPSKFELMKALRMDLPQLSLHEVKVIADKAFEVKP